MVRLSLNVSQSDFDTAGLQFAPVPVGDYAASIYEIGAGEVKNGPNAGKPRLKFQFRIVDGETAPDGSKQGNRRLFADINAFEGKNSKTGEPTPAYDLIAIGKAIGLSPEEIQNFDSDEWLGQELRVTVTHRRKQHQVGGQWVDIEPAEFREQVRGFRSLESVAVSAAAGATAKAATGAKKTFSL